MTRSRTPSALSADERGAIMLIGLFMGVFLAAALCYVAAIGEAIADRERMQDAADAAAFSAAVLHARGMNVIALINMVMAALLAILVALKLVETLCGIAIALIALAAFFLDPALVAAIPGIEELREQVREARNALEPEIENALETLHVLARGVRVVVPAAAQARAIALVSTSYRPPAELGFVLPAQATLPTDDAPFSQLCDHASDYIGTLVERALARPVPPAIAAAIADATSDLARGASDWYCGADGAPASTRILRHTRHPTLPSRALCADYANRADYDAAVHQKLCGRAQRDEEASQPDRWTGACVKQCTPDGPYAQRVELARIECAPDPARRFTSFSWVQREVQRRFVFRHGAWRLTSTHVVPGSTRRVKRDNRPCGRERGTIGKDWNLRTHAEGDRTEPVCSSDDTPAQPGVEGATFGPVRAIEVLHILGCSEDSVLRRDVARDPKDLHDNRDHARSPQMLASGAQLGEESFQLRAYVLGRAPRTNLERVLQIASWGSLAGSPEAASEQQRWSALLEAGRSAFAQAEFYFAGSRSSAAQRATLLWNMRWQARLRRFRLPEPPQREPSDERDAASAFGVQATTLDFASACSRARALAGRTADDAVACPTDIRAASQLAIH